MEDKMQGAPSKGLAIKIIIPVLIVAVIGGIWFSKNTKTQALPGGDTNPDFALHVTEAVDIEQLKSYGLPIMIDFGADSCIPCKEMAPVLVKLNKELQGKAIIKFVDVWKYQELAQGYPISVIPTQVFFDKDGKPFTPSDPEAMQMYMYSSRETNEHVFTTHEGGMTEEMILAVLREMGLEE
ncbi:MAG: thioredoxin [Peptococcaceae bacterium BICA1-8]|nr:MAG: thioredoxin [Peptococcaceae bacterium BICA1-8]